MILFSCDIIALKGVLKMKTSNLQLKETKHSYYCNETNYYVDGYNNYGRSEYDNWKDFKEEWLICHDKLDDDYNHVFRFDILEKRNEEDELTGEFELWLFFILQRKGIYRPVWIKNIKKDDMTDIEDFLKDRWQYLKNQWTEFSE